MSPFPTPGVFNPNYPLIPLSDTGYDQAQLAQTPLLPELTPPLLFPGTICFIKFILLLVSHICVTEGDTKYGYIFPLTYLKETV